MVCHSLLQWTTFCQTSPPWPSCLEWAHRAWLSFIELDKAVVLVWLNWLVFCEYGFSVSALWCPLATPTAFLGLLLPLAWGISSWLLQQSAAAARYLGRGVSPHCLLSWPSTWDSSSGPSCGRTASAPWTWGFIYIKGQGKPLVKTEWILALQRDKHEVIEFLSMWLVQFVSLIK